MFFKISWQSISVELIPAEKLSRFLLLKKLLGTLLKNRYTAVKILALIAVNKSDQKTIKINVV